MAKQGKPVPRLDQESKGFWEACQRHELYLQRCRSCASWRYYPRALCPDCLSDDTEWVRAGGKGKIYTFTVTHQNQAEGFRNALPYVLAYVELEEGPRLLTNIVGCSPDEIRIGLPVEVSFDDAEGAVPKFKPTT